MMVLTNLEPLKFPINSVPPLFVCQVCSRRVERAHINVWQWRSHDHIRARNTRAAQICDSCRPTDAMLKAREQQS